MFTASFHPGPAAERGVGLLEVLITVFVLAVGLLGIAGLNVISKQSGYEATQRTLAAALADDLMGRMRTNSDGANKPLQYYAPLTFTPSDKPQTPCTSCANAEQKRAETDLADWFEIVLGTTDKKTEGSTTVTTGGLVDPTVCLTGPGTPGDSGVYTVTVAWRGRGKLPDSGTANTCGEDTYDDQADDYAYRRMVVLSEYIPWLN